MKLKHSLLLLFFAAITMTVSAANQPDGKFKEWGKVTMDELKMTECSFEKKADAMLLLDLGQVYYKRSSTGYLASGKFRIKRTFYQRYKVFSERGTGNADKHLSLRVNNDEDIREIKAVSYNLVAGEIKKTELKQSDIHTTKNGEHQSSISFTVPGVTAGSVFEVGYEREEDVSYILPRWFFSTDLPSAYSSVTIGFLDALVYYIDQHVMVDALTESKAPFTSEIMVRNRSSGVDEPLDGHAITYVGRNLRSYQDEPYVNSSVNYKSWIGFQLVREQEPLNPNAKFIHSFDEFAKQLYDEDLFASDLESDPVPGKLWQSMLKPGMTPEEKTKLVYDYIRSNLEDNGREEFVPSSRNSKVWKDKTGSMTEINMILISALHTFGIRAYPMLVGSRANGEINTKFPILGDYVGVVALVMIDGGQNVILDATEKYLPFGEPGYDRLNTPGWVLQDRNNNFWLKLKEKKTSIETITINADIDDAGVISGTIDILNTNHNAEPLIHMKKAGHNEAISNALKKMIPNATIVSSTDSILIDKCYFSQKVKFTVQPATDNEVNIYLTVPGIYGSSANLFVNQDRDYDVDFGYTDKTILNMKITIPSSYTIDSVFKPVVLRMSDTSVVFINQVEANDGLLVWQQKTDYFKPYYKAAEYPELYDFEKKYFEIRQRPIVLKKKI